MARIEFWFVYEIAFGIDTIENEIIAIENTVIAIAFEILDVKNEVFAIILEVINIISNLCYNGAVQQLNICAVSSAGRAIGSQPIGHRFEPCTAHHLKPWNFKGFCGFLFVLIVSKSALLDSVLPLRAWYPTWYPNISYLAALLRISDEIDVVATRNPILVYDSGPWLRNLKA